MFLSGLQKKNMYRLAAFNRFKTQIKEPDYKMMVKSRLNGEYQKMIVSELKPSVNKTILEAQNIKSMLTIPIFVENKWWGTLGFDDCQREYNWSDSEIALLRTAGFLISSAILKDNLSAKRKQIGIIQHLTAYSTWEFDIHRKYLWYTSEVFGTTTNKTKNLQLSLRDMLKIIHPNDRRKLLDIVKEYIKKGTGKFRCDIQVLIKSNNYTWVELIGTIDNNSKKNKLIGIAIDINKRKKEENLLEREATTDPLTGILNRRKFEQIMQQQLITSTKNNNIFSFLMLDIDLFKKINDTYGHPVGDKIIIHIVNICKNILRKNDYIARVGGEEFAILLPLTNKKEANLIANRIRSKVELTPFLQENKTISSTISIGCVTHNKQIKEISDIYKLADLALYNAKNSGRNLVCSAD